MMKNIFSFLFIILLALGFSACEKDFLDTNPSDSIDAGSVFATTKSADAAINGIYRAMTRRYQDSQGHSGYPAHLLIIDLLAEDMVILTTSNSWHRAEQQWVRHRNDNNTLVNFGFDLFYRVISNANNVIAQIDNASGTQADINRIKGEALGLRALAYFNLVQMYAARYDASQKPNNQPGVSMPLVPTFEGLERSTVEQVYEQINKDLELASSIMTTARVNKSHINLNVIKGLHARVALAQQNWINAEKFAREARQGLSLMTTTQYLDGFASITNPEWMWGFNHIEEQTEYFGGFHSYVSCNFNSSVIRTAPKGINSLVYDKIAATDIRAQMWHKTPAAGTTIAPPGGVLRAYMGQKFRLPGVPSTSTMGDVPYMRTAEMYLIEAEALAHQGKFTDAADVLFELVSKRDPSYVKSTNTGQTLLEEIWWNRRVELWGEGFRWFDLKRLNQPLNRNGANHIVSNVLVLDVPAGDVRWTWLIPKRELDSNLKSVQNPLN